MPYVTAVLATVYKDLAQKTKAGFLKQANIVDLGAPGHDPVYGQGLLMAPSSCRPDAVPVPVPATASVVSGATVQASAGR